MILVFHLHPSKLVEISLILIIDQIYRIVKPFLISKLYNASNVYLLYKEITLYIFLNVIKIEISLFGTLLWDYFGLYKAT